MLRNKTNSQINSTIKGEPPCSQYQCSNIHESVQFTNHAPYSNIRNAKHVMYYIKYITLRVQSVKDSPLYSFSIHVKIKCFNTGNSFSIHVKIKCFKTGNSSILHSQIPDKMAIPTFLGRSQNDYKNNI